MVWHLVRHLCLPSDAACPVMLAQLLQFRQPHWRARRPAHSVHRVPALSHSMHLKSAAGGEPRRHCRAGSGRHERRKRKAAAASGRRWRRRRRWRPSSAAPLSRDGPKPCTALAAHQIACRGGKRRPQRLDLTRRWAIRQQPSLTLPEGRSGLPQPGAYRRRAPAAPRTAVASASPRRAGGLPR